MLYLYDTDDIMQRTLLNNFHFDRVAYCSFYSKDNGTFPLSHARTLFVIDGIFRCCISSDILTADHLDCVEILKSSVNSHWYACLFADYRNEIPILHANLAITIHIKLQLL